MVERVKAYNCLDTKFYGISYRELGEYPVHVVYCDDKAFLGFYYGGKEDVLTQEAYEECENFLEGHVAWGNLIMETGIDG